MQVADKEFDKVKVEEMPDMLSPYRAQESVAK